MRQLMFILVGGIVESRRTQTAMVRDECLTYIAELQQLQTRVTTFVAAKNLFEACQVTAIGFCQLGRKFPSAKVFLPGGAILPTAREEGLLSRECRQQLLPIALEALRRIVRLHGESTACQFGQLCT